MRRSIPSILSILLVSLAVSGIASTRNYVQVFFPSGRCIMAELAVTEEEKLRGLMFRDTINSDQGMLFVYEKEGYHSFWMKNVSFPIDIVWLDDEKRIVHIAYSVPPCQAEDCPTYSPDHPGRYVLELKAGTSLEEDLQLYDRLDFILEKDRVNRTI